MHGYIVVCIVKAAPITSQPTPGPLQCFRSTRLHVVRPIFFCAASGNMSFQYDRRLVLYPHYITAGKTVAEGRRIPKELACDNPNVLEMLESLKELQIPAIIEDKHYPRDWFIRCRLRVEWKRPDGSFVHPDIKDRRTLLVRIAELVPKHRKNMPQSPGAPSAPPVASSEAASSSSSGASKAAASKSSKKGKKGK